MTNRSWRISYLGCSVTVESRLPEEVCPIENVSKDFERFKSPEFTGETLSSNTSETDARIILTLSQDINQRFFLGLSVPWRGKSIGWTWSKKTFKRLIRTSCGTQVVLHQTPRAQPHITIASLNATEIYQLTFQYVLGLLGEQLERQGYTRLHAVSWMSRSQPSLAALLLADSGAGKSSLAAELQRQKNQILADEIVVYKNGRVFPFPLPIAVESLDHGDFPTEETTLTHRRRSWQLKKMLIPISGELPASAKIENVYELHRGRKTTGLHRASIWRTFVTGLEIVLGKGLPQMAEIYVRKSNFGHILRTAAARLSVSRQLSQIAMMSAGYSVEDRGRLKNIGISKMAPYSGGGSIADVENLNRG